MCTKISFPGLSTRPCISSTSMDVGRLFTVSRLLCFIHCLSFLRWRAERQEEAAATWQRLASANAAVADSLQRLQALSVSDPAGYQEAVSLCSSTRPTQVTCAPPLSIACPFCWPQPERFPSTPRSLHIVSVLLLAHRASTATRSQRQSAPEGLLLLRVLSASQCLQWGERSQELCTPRGPGPQEGCKQGPKTVEALLQSRTAFQEVRAVLQLISRAAHVPVRSSHLPSPGLVL